MSKLTYPKGRLLLVRDCTVDICLNNNPGAVLLSVLLFWYDNPHKGDVYNAAEGTFTICRTQAEIEEASCHQIDVKTIHDTGVPLLHLLGYLSVKEKMHGNLYTINIKCVGKAYDAFSAGPETLKHFLKAQLESAPIEIPEDQLERTLINKSRLYFEIARTLIRIREDSNCKRGRKPRTQQAAEANSENTEIYRDIYENSTKREGGAFAPGDFLPGEEDELPEEDEAPTVHKMPAIKLNGHTPEAMASIPGSTAFPPAVEARPLQPGDVAPVIPPNSESRPPEEPKETAKQQKARIERRKTEIIALYCELLGRKKIVLSKDNQDGSKLLAEAEATDAEITLTYNTYKNHSFWGKQLHLKNIAKLLDTTVTSGNGASMPGPAKPKTRPKPEDRNVTIFEYDPYWQVWKRPGDEQEWIWWQEDFWTPEEADDRGYGGGAGLYVSNQPQYTTGVQHD